MKGKRGKEWSSGNTFSPWAAGATQRIITPAADTNFDFEQLMSDAVAREHELEDNDTEGDELASALDAVSLSIPPTSPQPTNFSHMDSTTTSPSHGKSRSGTGLTEDSRRKRRSHAKHTIERLEAKRAAPYGKYAIKPKVLNKYVRPATSINTKLDTIRLKHTKHAYTGGKDKGGLKRLYELHKLVGEDSHFKFKLERWNGWFVGFVRHKVNCTD
jgi:hypothetical protein